MNDLISREDAIKAIAVAVLDDKDEIEAIKALPSAEGGDADMTVIPEGTGLMKPCPDNGADLISRQDAIEAVRVCDVFLAYQGDKIANNIDGFVDSIVEQMRNNIARAVSALPSAEAENESCGTCKYFETSHREYPCSDCTVGNSHYVSAEAVHGEWIFNPTDAIDLMFAKPKCSKCGFESSDGGNFCPNCGAKMNKGGEDE